MIYLDEDALICDLCETYGLFSYRQIPARLLAKLAIGLREDSRIKMKISKQKVPTDMLIQSIIADRLGILIWQKSKDGAKGRNMPKSIYETLIQTKKESNVMGFNTVEEYEKAKQKILKEVT